MLVESAPEPVENLITWVFDEGTFRPAAKIVDGRTFSIVTDYLGTPVEMYNEAGLRTWAVEYDIYGKIRKQVVGHPTDCPFRYQGQYEDSETGLCYNRFRYYSAKTGTYISQDPIGLAGNNPNHYAYTSNSTVAIDPLGLSECSADGYEFNMINNPGPLSKKTNNPASNFAGGKYNKRILSDDTIFYRGGTKDSPLGQWFTVDAPESIAKVRIDSAVKSQWIDKNGVLTGSSPLDSVHTVKFPKGTTIFEGPVGNQGGIYLGGQNMKQIFIETPWKLPGVNVLKSGPLL